MATKKTREVLEMLGMPYTKLWSLIRCGHLAPPGKDASGDYAWTPADIQRARAAFDARRKK